MSGKAQHQQPLCPGHFSPKIVSSRLVFNLVFYDPVSLLKH